MGKTTKPAKVETSELDTQSTDIVIKAQGMVVNNKAQLEEVAVVLNGIKGLLREADEVFDGNIKRWHVGHTEAISDKKMFTAPLLAVRKYLRDQASGYTNRMKRLAEKAAREKEEKLRAEAAAKRRAEEERLAKLRAELEAKRREEEERRAKIEAENLASLNAGLEDLPGADDTPLEEEVVDEAEEEIAQIEEKLAAPEPEIVVTPRAAPKVAGMATPTTYTAKVVNKAAFVRACLIVEEAGGDWLNFIQIDQSALNAFARREEVRFDLPGCELVTDTNVRSTG